ncbi:hypothetical protein E3N88_07427 [Mikania micrantha]|uniref:Glycosyltransferase n=1 Tax=Mikania micrantha TaxID=192012 RepID=A0A5N6PS76_9ASTR|nr:hypothetical protein E3N88_07427 [Mikania micrantha]
MDTTATAVRRLVLLPIPFQGHLNPMLQLATILHSKGFSITILHTLFNSPNPTNYPNFTFLPISGAGEHNLSVSDINNIVRLLTYINTSLLDPIQACLQRLMSEDGGVVCLITDALWFGTQMVADRLKLPRMVHRTSSISSFRSFAAIQLLRQISDEVESWLNGVSKELAGRGGGATSKELAGEIYAREHNIWPRRYLIRCSCNKCGHGKELRACLQFCTLILIQQNHMVDGVTQMYQMSEYLIGTFPENAQHLEPLRDMANDFIGIVNQRSRLNYSTIHLTTNNFEFGGDTINQRARRRRRTRARRQEDESNARDENFEVCEPSNPNQD